MTVYVDELKKWPTKIRCFKAGSCHLTADAVEELHAFAAALGLRAEWFQRSRIPHYDITAGKREIAIKLGAMFVPAKEQARRRIAAREADALLDANTPESVVEEQLRSMGLDPEKLRAEGTALVTRLRKEAGR